MSHRPEASRGQTGIRRAMCGIMALTQETSLMGRSSFSGTYPFRIAINSALAARSPSSRRPEAVVGRYRGAGRRDMRRRMIDPSMRVVPGVRL